MDLNEKTLKVNPIFDGKIIHVHVDDIELANGKPGYREVRRDLSRGGSPKFIKSCNPGTFLNLDSTVLGTYWMKAQLPFVSVGSCAYAIIT